MPQKLDDIKVHFRNYRPMYADIAGEPIGQHRPKQKETINHATKPNTAQRATNSNRAC